MLNHNIFKLFLSGTIICATFLVYLWYQDYKFENNPLQLEYQRQINIKTLELQKLAYKKFNIKKNFPIIVSDKMPSNIFGLARYGKNTQISIYLNKSRFKENSNYMINDVLPHEYAHAIMFYIKDFTKENSGHSKRWQNICRKLNGLRCDRFVNHQDILIEKTKLF